MSAIQDLIHTTQMNAYDVGVKAEQERIIELLKKWGEDAGCFCCASDVAASEIVDLIKGETE